MRKCQKYNSDRNSVNIMSLVRIFQDFKHTKKNQFLYQILLNQMLLSLVNHQINEINSLYDAMIISLENDIATLPPSH